MYPQTPLSKKSSYSMVSDLVLLVLGVVAGLIVAATLAHASQHPSLSSQPSSVSLSYFASIPILSQAGISAAEDDSTGLHLKLQEDDALAASFRMAP